MPKIAEFDGIAIIMYQREHEPPHFHVRYGEFKAAVGIDPLRVLKGRLPPRIQRLVFEWASLHQRELLDNWELVRIKEPAVRIAPLV